MIIFFISDIHGNQFALSGILEHAMKINSDKIICSGDISGYFLGVNDVVKLLQKYNVKSIMGNHDAILLGLLPLNEHTKYYSSIIKSRLLLTESSLNFMKGMNPTELLTIANKQIRVYHGGPDDVFNQYIFPDKLISYPTGFSGADFFVFGHSHLQFVVKLGNNCFINPGSVGLPRNGDYRAHGISYDSEKDLWEEHKVNYDLISMLNMNQEEDASSPFLHNILFGRSSGKKLKKNNSEFLDQDFVYAIKAKNLNLINTKYGAIILKNRIMDSSGIFYIAHYDDESIELTSNNIFFSWQETFTKERNIIDHLNFDLLKDSSGYYFRKVYCNLFSFEKSFLIDLDTLINLYEKSEKKEWKNIMF